MPNLPSLKTATAIALVTAFAAGVATSAVADTTWQENHPRREEVNNRLANQNARIHDQVKEGELTKAQAARLHKDDRQIRKEERAMASQNGGHITKLEQKTLSLPLGQAAWEKETLARYQAGQLDWHYQRPFSAKSANGAKLTIYNDELVDSSYYMSISLVSERRPGDGLVVVSGPNPDNETYTVAMKPGAGQWTALGLEVMEDESLPGIRVARGADRLVVSDVEAELSGKKLPFTLATSSVTKAYSPLYPAMAAIDGDPKTGWGVSMYGENRGLFLALRFSEELQTQADSVLMVRLRQDSEYRRATIGRFRLALSSGKYSWPEPSDPKEKADKAPAHHGLPEDVVKALQTTPDKRTDEQEEALESYFEWTSPELQPLILEVAKLEADLSMLTATISKVRFISPSFSADIGRCIGERY